MNDYLILKLEGPMQAWGLHTYEDYRPSNLFPTHSGVLGLLAACLGIRRGDRIALETLAGSVEFAVRADAKKGPGGKSLRPVKIRDFHTVMDARKVDGGNRKDPVVSSREYLCDASFTVAVRMSAGTKSLSLEEMRRRLQQPIFTPFLGRRACPLSRPLFEALVKAEDFEHALRQVEPFAGVIYSEHLKSPQSEILMRDVPRTGDSRQFSTRMVGIISVVEEGAHVPE